MGGSTLELLVSILIVKTYVVCSSSDYKLIDGKMLIICNTLSMKTANIKQNTISWQTKYFREMIATIRKQESFWSRPLCPDIST